MFNEMFCHGKNDLQNQVLLGKFWAGGVKWGYMTKKHFYVMVIVIGIFLL